MASKRPELRRKRTFYQNEPAYPRGAGRRLLAAVLIFLFCLGGKMLFPTRTAAGIETLHTLLTSSSDFESAFSVLGDDLAEGKGLAVSVGNWCVAVFSPQPVTVDEKSAAVPASASEEKETENWLQQLLTRLRELLPSD